MKEHCARPPQINGPLKFGDANQIAEIKRYESDLKTPCDPELCDECDGEGTVTCNSCDGSGEKK
jgi:hypothetical protein